MEKITTITTLSSSRRSKWQYPTAQPTPRILHFPRRPRRKTPAKTNGVVKPSFQRDRKVKLETLFDEEREFSKGYSPVVVVDDYQFEGEGRRRERAEERESEVVEEEKWRFQAEMLRAECNLLRMERAIAVKKMERRKVQVETVLRSAVQTLLSGRKRISEGKNASIVLEEEITELAEKLEKLQRRSKHKDSEVQNCNNFDKQASLLRTRIEKFSGESDEIYVKEIQEMAEASLSLTSTSENLASDSSNMEILRRKMEALSRENLLDESTRRPLFAFEKNKCEERACCGCCKAIAKRVVDQIRAETEQWSQMQEILGQVRDEMDELQASRAFWEDRAHNSDHEIQSLHSVLSEWKRKALSSEAKANELQAKVSVLESQPERNRTKNVGPITTSHDSSNEMEERVLVCRLKENRHRKDEGYRKTEASGDGRRKSNACSSGFSRRTPFREIGNSPTLIRQNSNNTNSGAVFPLQSPLPFKSLAI